MAQALFFADVLWNTALLPNSITVGGITYNKRAPNPSNPLGDPLPLSINGVESRGPNPLNDGQMIRRANQNISYYCYNGAVDDPLPFDCRANLVPFPSRYVAMGAGNVGDQLIVNGTGANEYTYLATDVRYPPNYIQGGNPP